jgi:hypothetical protein
LGRSRRALWVALLLTIAFCGGGAPVTRAQSDPVNLLRGLSPVRIEGVNRVGVLTDGIFCRQGDFWSTDLTAIFTSAKSFVVYDLGRTTSISAIVLQGDNNDKYSVELSEDGVSYTGLWTAPESPRPGMQARFSPELTGSGRYVRIGADGGDGAFSLSEVQMYSVSPALVPRPQMLRGGTDTGETLRTHVLLLTLALALLAVLAYRKAPIFVLGAGLVVAGVEVVSFYQAISQAWPVTERDVAMVRGAVAALAALVIAREVWLVSRFRANPNVVLGLLIVCAAVSMSAFYNLGMAQYWDYQKGKPGYVHNYDMHVYYPVAKYFRELGFDGLYLASTQAYIENVPSASVRSLANVELRDLRTHRVVLVKNVVREMAAVKERFSPERWEEFKEDVRYFHENMGSRDFLGNMTDHGGNATPVWIAIAHLLFANTRADNTTLLWGGLLDPLLLLVLFAVVWRTFGPRTALMTAIVFGANDFYMFGTNWAGATLRHDWLVYAGLGVCALKTERWTLGGALLAASTMIRAFPVVALAGTALPALFWLWQYRKDHNGWPPFKQWRYYLTATPAGSFAKIAMGAAVAAFALFVFSSAICSVGAWGAWLQKVSLLDRSPHVNDVSLRCLVGGSGEYLCAVYGARWIVFAVLVAAIGVGIIGASSERRFHHSALVALFMVPVIFNPANYYIHFICLIPMLAAERNRSGLLGEQPAIDVRDAIIWLTLLFICVAQYWSVLAKDLELHFQLATAILFTGIAAILITLNLRPGAKNVSR